MLLAVWSVSAFVLEVPSGAWADRLDRRRLLIASGVVYVGAFATWTTAPTFWGFLLGFCLWSLSDALHSGTWEAYLYDQLDHRGQGARYGRVRARSESAALIVMASAIAAAAPLHALGGYPLVSAVSVGVAALHVGVTVCLPPPVGGRSALPVGAPPEHPSSLPTTTPRAVAPEPEPDSEHVTPRSWWGTVRAGAGLAWSTATVRRILVGYAAIVALVGFDEYFPLLLAADGRTEAGVAVVMAAIVLLEAAGTWLSDRVAMLTGWRHALLVGCAGLVLAAGAWWSGWAAAAALGTGYALASAAYVAGDVRLQHTLGRSAPRATVTSVASVVAELGFLLTLGVVGVATRWLDLTLVVTCTALAVTVPAALAAWRMPAAPADGIPPR